MKKFVWLLSLPAISALAAENVVLNEVSIVGSVAKGSGKVEYMSPSSTSVISKEQMEEKGAQGLDEAIKYESGAVGQLYGADIDTSAEWLKIRGFDATMTIDGSSPYKGGYFGYQPDLYGYESIEILKGANSTVFGSSNAGGIINLISKRPTNSPFAEVGFKLGSKNQRGVFFDASDNLYTDRVKFRLVGDYEKKDGEIDYVTNEHYYIAPSLMFLLGDETVLTLLTSYTKDKGTGSQPFFSVKGTLVNEGYGKISPSTSYGATNDSLERHYYTAGYELTHNINDSLNFTSSYKFIEEDKDYFGAYYFFDSAPGVAQPYGSVADAVIKTHTFDNRLAYDYKSDNFENKVIFGIDYRKMKGSGFYGDGMLSPLNKYNPARIYQARPIVPGFNLNQSQVGFYLQDEAKIYNNLILTSAIRHDKTKTTVNMNNTGLNGKKINQTTFSLGAMYVFEELGLMPFANYSESFTPPTATDNYGNAKPLEGKQVEVGVKYLPNFIDAEITASYFDAKLENSNIADGSAFGRQVGKQISRGFELSSNVNLLENLNWLLSYTHYNSTKTDLSTTQTIRTKMMPKDTLSSWLTYKFELGQLGTIKAGAGLRYVGSTVDNQYYPDYRVPSYTLLDAMIGYTYKKWDFALNATNLTDKEYISAVNYWAYYGEGLRATLTAKYKF
ncbi:TonB-dependent siderophore receptor [Campylobacter sp. RM9344]|uniref:TonB-dependent siderophore receptor n=1 Tax=Campylobacter californiensis TaxID=1032243 RepID=A0AAW3ZV17_9BACT|nr:MULTISPECIES: TonB-dependent siderophore receptor [unclassified Campylobacter]MBE2984995.1 TonB-dependent siderophore receptor [Campylobacter sp. RM6883]MBE2986773.1 TonB-dependent siderophore receptor [Campylobacter sp. RM12919]MBE2988433.1 TonB-dependent siderophore receptor [Campylobacter sp. RM12920]MBE2995191.1 TonB-dependent siderophore receptor [Campylobacter sp. RM6913]MBE3029553.1 TonB-dependent siderophore receptor [Campylobacter sp. RM9344]